jgi:hypothetical protein
MSGALQGMEILHHLLMLHADGAIAILFGGRTSEPPTDDEGLELGKSTSIDRGPDLLVGLVATHIRWHETNDRIDLARSPRVPFCSFDDPAGSILVRVMRAAYAMG